MMKHLKKVMALAAASAMVFGAVGCSSSESSADSGAEEKIQIGIIQLVEHAALDAACAGFKDALAENGYGEDVVEIDFQNAQNDQANLKTISQRFVNNEVDLILAIATPAAQSVAAETSEIPILVTAVTDLVGADLIEDNNAPGTNVSGTSDMTPVALQFDLMQRILPEAKTVGIMYTSSEVNSEIQAQIAIEAAEERGMAYEIGTITNVNDAAQVVYSLAEKVDVIYIPTDNVLASAMANVSAVATESGIPIIVGEGGQCEAGGLATVGLDYYKLGFQTGEMAIEVLNGADVSAMPVQYAADASIAVNTTTAAALGITIPEDVMAEVVDIYE